jgi:hypothetical protein
MQSDYALVPSMDHPAISTAVGTGEGLEATLLIVDEVEASLTAIAAMASIGITAIVAMMGSIMEATVIAVTTTEIITLDTTIAAEAADT